MENIQNNLISNILKIELLVSLYHPIEANSYHKAHEWDTSDKMILLKYSYLIIKNKYLFNTIAHQPHI